MSDTVLVKVEGADAHAMVFSLDAADAQMQGYEWAAVFAASSGLSESEKLALLVLARAHGASAAYDADGPIGAREGSALARDMDDVATLKDQKPQICVASTQPRDSLATRAWHRTAWESGFAPRICDVTTEYGVNAVRQARLVFTDNSVPDAVIDDLCDAGIHVVRDVSSWQAVPTYADSGFIVQRISRAQSSSSTGANIPAPGAKPGPLLREASPLLTRALDLISDPAPAPRALSDECVVENFGDGADVIAIAPNSDAPAIVRQKRGSSSVWLCLTHLDAATRHAMMTLACAVARISPPPLDLPDGVEAVWNSGAVYLVNHGDKAKELSGIIGYDIVSQAQCTGHVMLAPSSAMLVITADETQAPQQA